MSPDAIKLALALTTTASLLIALSPSPAQAQFAAQPANGQQQTPPGVGTSDIEADEAEESLSHLLISRFTSLFFEAQPEEAPSDGDGLSSASPVQVTRTPSYALALDPLASSNGFNEQQQQRQRLELLLNLATATPLETRNDDIAGQQKAPPLAVEPESLKRRNYFRVLDHVFSRVEMPQVFRSPKGNLNSYCANFIGCIDDIPGLPAILRRSNISSTFTLYTSSRPRGLRIPYEPLQHHQLGDVNMSVVEIASRLQLQQQHQKSQLQHQLQHQLQLLQHQHQLAHPLHPLTLQHPIQQQLSHFHQLHQHQLLNKPMRASGLTPGAGSAISRAQPLLAGVARRAQASGPALAKATSARSWASASMLKRVQEYPFDLSALETSGFKSSENTRIIIGGYFAKEDEHWIEDLVELWRQLEPSANIIKVSWPDANRGLYHSAALNSRVVGRQLSLFLHYLDQMFTIDLGRFHLVGHSLGAHIAGFVGADNQGRIGRITGLDPAGPIFIDMDETMRLDPNDAHFVDVVHTNAGSITKGALGLTTPSGHVDYYPNGGSQQPGCYSSSMAIMDPVERVACNHRRSYRYFIEILRLTIEQQQPHHSGEPAGGATSNQQHQPASDATTAISPLLSEPLSAKSRRQRQAPQMSPPSSSTSGSSVRPTAFLFEAKDDELDRLATQQPDLLCLDSKALEPRHRSDECELGELPARRLVEFHQMKPDFPAGKRGLYFLRTRPEAPFFSSRQYGVTLRSANALKRKISISLRLDKAALPDFELEQIDSSLTLLFVPAELSRFNLSADLWFMWRYRSFTLLSTQPDELSLSGLELLELESSPTPSVIKYSAPNASQPAPLSSSPLRRAGGPSSDWPALIRNRWYKFERS